MSELTATDIFGITVLGVVAFYCVCRAAIALVMWASAAFENSIPEDKDLWGDVDNKDGQ